MLSFLSIRSFHVLTALFGTLIALLFAFPGYLQSIGHLFFGVLHCWSCVSSPDLHRRVFSLRYAWHPGEDP